MRKLKLGISTCPNDTYIFDAMLHGKIDTGEYSFDCQLTDVEELNKDAFNSVPDITKISFHAYAYVSDKYLLLNSGSALGFNNGPLLVCSEKNMAPSRDMLVAIPGKYTTANLLLSIIYPELVHRKEYVFSGIEDAVLTNETDAGLLIHENRFTYKDRGLFKIADLGEKWLSMTGMPVPLGGIAIKRDLGEEIALDLQSILKSSIEYANNHPESSYDFRRKYAASMDEDVMKRHIELYVNDFSLDLGPTGREAIRLFYQRAEESGAIPVMHPELFTGLKS